MLTPHSDFLLGSLRPRARSLLTRPLRTLAMATLLLTALSGAAAATEPQPPVVSFESRAIVATNVTPSGRVIFFGMAIEGSGGSSYSVVFAHRERALDADSSGAARLDLAVDVAPRSIWAVVDVTTGQYLIAAPPGQATQPLTLATSALGRNSAGNVLRLEVPFELANILVVRPGVGAWELSVAEGGPSDDGGHAKGRVSSAVSHFSAMGDSRLEGLTSVQNGDVVVIFEPRRLLYYAFRVGA